MSFGSRLTHTVSIVRRSDTAVYDNYNHPVPGESVIATPKAAIQRRRTGDREQILGSQAGAAVADYTVFLFPTDLTTADAIVHDASVCPVTSDLPDSQFEVVGISNAAGLGHHLEVEARLVSSPQEAEGS